MKIAGPPNAEKRRTLYLENKYLGPNAIKKRPVYPYLKDIIACGERRCVHHETRGHEWYKCVVSIGEVLDYQPVKPSGCRGSGSFHCKQRYTWVSREPIKYSILGVSNQLCLFHYGEGLGTGKRGPCYTTKKYIKKDLQNIINNQLTLRRRKDPIWVAGPRSYKSSTTKADLWKIIMKYD